MSSRKQTPPSFPWTEGEKYSSNNNNNSKFKEIFYYFFTLNTIPYVLVRCCALLFLFLSASWLLLLLFCFPPTTTTTSSNDVVREQAQVAEPQSPFKIPTCDKNMSVYVYTLPPQFNLGLLSQCNNLSIKANMCPAVANSGLGQPLNYSRIGHSAVTSSWYITHQYTAEIIFHARLQNHPCRVQDPARATLFYVPFYGGFDALNKYREANLTVRDELTFSLVDYIQAQPWWQRNHGKDHFMALGTVVWDFMRTMSNASASSSSKVRTPGTLLKLPATENMSVLIIERHPWQPNQHGIPYPSYFHPSTWREMAAWQRMMRLMERPHLFSFVGARRKNKAAIRNEFIRQCGESTRCKLLKCEGPDGARKCLQPREIMRVMTRSQFCLQAPGDTPTRRSTFDSVLAGCVPVFFSRHTAYSQYAWYLPGDASRYSVYIDEKSNASRRIEEELLKISSEKVKMMREEIIDLMPSLTYAHPNATDFGFGDAVDVALASLAKHIGELINSN
ncbi:putative xyloglucan galactosyltransferase GT17 [Prunus yedoensis var. nudiflora]|uniref:Putative xyloglucan galactosyltransferase GT17 n=1 Tax=Prunus yedoensis var. nudiflora TaxID=2094558 RepID=A0A314XSI5_PRUYE|nr:putative xyloglucan galactosyltransferase GT17 [Prunus yedoensis var. nudiflora]